MLGGERRQRAPAVPDNSDLAVVAAKNLIHAEAGEFLGGRIEEAQLRVTGPGGAGGKLAGAGLDQFRVRVCGAGGDWCSWVLRLEATCWRSCCK